MVPFSFPLASTSIQIPIFKKILPRVVLARGGYRGCGSEKAPHPILAPHTILEPHLKKSLVTHLDYSLVVAAPDS